MNSKQKQEMYNKITAHGEQLKVIFNLDPATDPVTLCKKLRIIERKQHSAAEGLCNLPKYQGQYDKITAQTEKALIKLLGDKVPVYINDDPLGYSLKIDYSLMRANNFELHRDWGGYGILAPDFTPEE